SWCTRSAPGQAQALDGTGKTAAQAPPGHRADHRTPEGRSPDGPLSLEGRIRRPAARSPVRGGLQHQMAAAHDRQEGRALPEGDFLCLAKGTMPRRFWPALAASRPGDRLNDSLGVRKLRLLAA